MGLSGILLALGAMIWFAYRGWSILLLAPAAALLAAATAREPLLASWTLTFMSSAAGFVAEFFPLFLLGALFGKLMDDSGSVSAIATLMTEKLGPKRAILAVVLAGAMLTYGGVSLFVAFFVLAPMGRALFAAGGIPHRLMPGAVVLGTSTFTMSALPGTPSIQNAIPMPFFGTTPFAAPGLGILASAIMLGFGLWWLGWRARVAQRAGEGYGVEDGAVGQATDVTEEPLVRERATTAHEFDPAETLRGHRTDERPSALVALTPLVVVIVVNLLMSFVFLPRWNVDFLALPRWGETTLAAVAGIWSVVVALCVAIACLVALNFRRLTALRESMGAGGHAAVLPIMSVASLVGFGSVVASLPAFALVRDWVLSIEGGPLVSLAVATNVLAALTGSASGGMTIALQSLGENFMAMSDITGLSPALMHRVAVIGAGTLDTLPHNGAVVTLLAVCGATHRRSYPHIVMAGIVGPLMALAAVIALGSVVGEF